MLSRNGRKVVDGVFKALHARTIRMIDGSVCICVLISSPKARAMNDQRPLTSGWWPRVAGLNLLFAEKPKMRSQQMRAAPGPRLEPATGYSAPRRCVYV